MRPRFALHLAAIIVLAVGVCWGALARSRPDAITGADVKRLTAASRACTVVVGQAKPVAVPAAGLLAALPDGAGFRRSRLQPLRSMDAFAHFPELDGLSVLVGRDAVYLSQGRRYLRADVDQAAVDRVRADLLAAVAAQSPPAAAPPSR